MNIQDRILETALDLFLEHGFDGTGIGRILAQSNVSRGGLYHHFKDKQALYEEVLARFFLAPFKTSSLEGFGSLPCVEQQALLVSLFREMPSKMETISRHGSTRYFAFFFDAMTRSESFAAAVRQHYETLLTAMQIAISRDQGLPIAAARQESRAFLAGLEGELYLSAVLQ